MKNKFLVLFILLSIFSATGYSQQTLPCSSNPVYKQLDFWVGEWDVYNKRNIKVGDSRIENIVDGCAVLENYQTDRGYKAKSISTYNDSTKQWQQTYVDNGGLLSEMRKGYAEENKLIFIREFVDANGTMTPNRTRMTISKINPDTVSQLVEQSQDAGKTWSIMFNLEYRRKK